MSIVRRMIAVGVVAVFVAVPIGSFFADWRAAHGSRWMLAYALFGLGAFISTVNCYLRLVRPAVHRLRGGSPRDLRNTSSVPLFGMLTVPGLALGPPSLAPSVLCVVLVAVDMGNVVWFLVSTWNDASFWGGERSVADPPESE